MTRATLLSAWESSASRESLRASHVPCSAAGAVLVPGRAEPRLPDVGSLGPQRLCLSRYLVFDALAATCKPCALLRALRLFVISPPPHSCDTPRLVSACASGFPSQPFLSAGSSSCAVAPRAVSLGRFRPSAPRVEGSRAETHHRLRVRRACACARDSLWLFVSRALAVGEKKIFPNLCEWSIVLPRCSSCFTAPRLSL